MTFDKIWYIMGLFKAYSEIAGVSQNEIISLFVMDSIQHLRRYVAVVPVSYTHLDVYKRQREGGVSFNFQTKQPGRSPLILFYQYVLKSNLK